MYRLHGKATNRSMRTLWMLEELGVAYALVDCAPRSPEALALSPLGKVPILETDEGVVLDSTAQMQFLADRHGAFTHPAGTLARGRQDAVTCAALEMMDAPLWTLAQHKFVLPEAMRVPAIKPPTVKLIAHNGERLAALLEGDYAAGDAPTVPDIVLAHCAAWAMNIGIELHPAIAAHRARMEARPAYGRAAEHRKAAA